MDEVSGLKEFAQLLLNRGEQRQEITSRNVSENPAEAQLTLVPDGLKIVDLKTFLPKCPSRKLVDLTMLELGSFIKYVNEQKNSPSRIFAQLKQAPYTFKAIIDWHGTDGQPADWCDHKVTLSLEHSENFKVWHGKNNKPMSQAEFAEFLKDNRLDVTEPDNARLLELVQELDATSEARYLSKLPTNSGVALSFQENIKTNVTMPDKLTLRLPLFAGGESQDVLCEFKFKPSGEGRLYFSFRMLAIERALREAVKAMSTQIEKETGLPVYV